MRAWVTGTSIGLAVAFPAVVVAQILDAILDDGRPALVTVLLLAVVLAGPVVGAFVAAGRRDRGLLVGVAIGATCLFVIAGFGALRRGVADEDVELWTVPALTIIGGVLGAVGVLGSRAARTRR